MSRLNALEPPRLKFAFQETDGNFVAAFPREYIAAVPGGYTEIIERTAKAGTFAIEDAAGTALPGNNDFYYAEVMETANGKAGCSVKLLLNSEGVKKYSLALKRISSYNDGRNYVIAKLDGEALWRRSISASYSSEELVIEPGMQEASAFFARFLAAIVNYRELPCEVKVTPDENIVALVSEPLPEPEDWRPEGYEDFAPFREFELLWVNGKPTGQKRYTGNLKQEEPPQAERGGSKPESSPPQSVNPRGTPQKPATTPPPPPPKPEGAPPYKPGATPAATVPSEPRATQRATQPPGEA